MINISEKYLNDCLYKVTGKPILPKDFKITDVSPYLWGSTLIKYRFEVEVEFTEFDEEEGLKILHL